MLCRHRNRFALIFSFAEKINIGRPQFANWGQQASAGHLHSVGFVSRLRRKINAQTPMGPVHLFGAGNRNRTGTDFTPRDFKSLVSTYSTMPASLSYRNTIFAFRQGEERRILRRLPLRNDGKLYSWSIFRPKGSRQLSINQCSSGISIASMASMDCLAAKSNSVLPAFCSSTHLI